MFAFLVRCSLRNRVFVLAIATILLAIGGVNLARLPVDVLPDLNQGLVTIMTEGPGLSPEEVEQLISMPVEAAINGVAGVKRVRSTSTSGLSIVFVEFELSTDIFRARQFVTERLQTVAGVLPPGTQPTLMPMSSLMGEILLVALSAERQGDSPAADPMQLRDLAAWVVMPRLRSIPGVSQVIPIGGLVRQYLVTPDPLAMSRVDVTVADIEQALQRFGTNTSGGVVNRNGQEFQIRTIGQPQSLGTGDGIRQLGHIVVAMRDGLPIELAQVAEVGFGAMPRVGDAGFMGRDAVILTIVKQPGADTLALTRQVEDELESLRLSLPHGANRLDVLFRQADFIETSVDNVQHVLLEAVAVVAVILLLFLGNLRTTVISLTAIPLSMLVTFMVFRLFDLSINTMTLGGLAIAIGELVDDAVVDVENILRRLRQNRRQRGRKPALEIIADASQEVRSGIVYSTLIIILVFVPLFAIPGIEGRMFAPLGVAYIVSIVASLITSITVTPVLASLLLPNMRQLDEGDGPLVRGLKFLNARGVGFALNRPRLAMGIAAAGVAAAAAIVPTLPRTFLPGFNESSLVVSVTLQPGISLDQSARVGAIAEHLIMTVPEVRGVGRRTGRSESDEHALGVHANEIEVDVVASQRPLPKVIDDIRTRLRGLPAAISVEQPISHRLFDHILTGISAQVVVKVFGDDLDRIRAISLELEQRLKALPGLTDVMVERQIRVPQIRVGVDGQRAAMYGVAPGALAGTIEHLAGGTTVSQVVSGQRRVPVVLRLAETNRSPLGLSGLLIETPSGRVPLSYFGSISETSAVNEIQREGGRRRIAVTANGRADVDRAATTAAIRDEISRIALPPGYSLSFEGTFAEQDDASVRLVGLGLVSLTLIFTVLYARYRSATLACIIMANVPLALVGSVIAIKLAHLDLSLASMIGFVTLTGIATRNGILKVSHTINLLLNEGERFSRAIILRAAQERMVPVLMTATSAGVALIPLLYGASAPGKEILHPVAVVIFGGLLGSTALDTFLTPALLLRFGRAPMQRLLAVPGRPAVSDAY
jgi:CzcA family heavy metal efflux pump